MSVHNFNEFLLEFKGGFGGFRMKTFGDRDLQPAPETTSGGGNFGGFGGGGNDIGDDGDFGGFEDDDESGNEGTNEPRSEQPGEETNDQPIDVSNNGYSVEFKWDARMTVGLIKKHAPADAVCAIVYGGVYGMSKTRNVEYFDQQVTDRDEPFFPLEPQGKHKLMGRKLIDLTKKRK